MNITEEGDKMPMGIAFDKDVEDMIKASKKKGKVSASKTIKKPKPNMQYQDLEGPRETWEQILEGIFEGSNSWYDMTVDQVVTRLVENYHPPKKL